MSASLATRKTIEELVREWNLGTHELKLGLESIKRAEEHLKAFTACGTGWDLQAFRHDCTSLDFEKKITRMRAAAWRYLVDRIELKKLASVRRAGEIDDQLHNRPETLPDITVENISEWIRTMGEQAGAFLDEAVVEVYERLRPRLRTHKTNSAFKVGKKVILTGRVNGYRPGSFRVVYYFQDELRALDNVMHMLDGKALSAYREGDLCRAIEDTEGGVGETEFFRFKCYGNGNLHLEFRRLDLVQQLNEIGGRGLPDPDRD